jgi:hypothetical protein
MRAIRPICGGLMSVICTGLALPATAGKLSCYDNDVTASRTCYAPSEVKMRDGIRYAPMYYGGPQRVHESGVTLAINCSTGQVHLKDRDGVSFAGGQGGTPALTALRNWICEERIKAPAAKAKP